MPLSAGAQTTARSPGMLARIVAPMTIRSIVVHLDVAPESLERQACAHALADRFGARVTALFGSAEQAPPPFAHSAAAALRAAQEDEGSQDIARARLQARHVQRGHGGIWCEVGSELVSALVAEAAYADLLVLGRPAPPERTEAASPAGLVESCVLRSGAPALVLPHPHRQGIAAARILIAWDGSAQAARAARSALPFLREAEQVDVACWGRSPARAPFSQLGLADWLERHGIGSRQHRHDAPTDVGDALCAFAQEIAADLIVMGCYSHGPWRERLFGGATRSVLRALPAPVLMAH